MIEITQENYDTLWKMIEQIQADKNHMHQLHNDIIENVMKLNEIIFDRTNDIIHYEKENERLKKEIGYLYGDLEEIKINTICEPTKKYIDNILKNRK